jgi:hypothetical protein
MKGRKRMTLSDWLEAAIRVAVTAWGWQMVGDSMDFLHWDFTALRTVFKEGC